MNASQQLTAFEAAELERLYAIQTAAEQRAEALGQLTVVTYHHGMQSVYSRSVCCIRQALYGVCEHN